MTQKAEEASVDDWIRAKLHAGKYQRSTSALKAIGGSRWGRSDSDKARTAVEKFYALKEGGSADTVKKTKIVPPKAAPKAISLPYLGSALPPSPAPTSPSPRDELPLAELLEVADQALAVVSAPACFAQYESWSRLLVLCGDLLERRLKQLNTEPA